MKKKNILELYFLKGKNSCYPHFKKDNHFTKSFLQSRVFGSLLFVSFFLFNGCFSIFRPTPVLEDDKSDLLKIDKNFILLNENLTPVENPDFSNLDQKVKSLQKAKSFYELNNLAVYGAKLSYIESSEEVFKKLQKEKPQEMVPYLNLLRVYYVLDEYDIAKQMLNNFYKVNVTNKSKIFEFMQYLKATNRSEEYVIFLDVVSNYPEYEIKALEEIGFYFLSTRDLNLAQSYFERILTIYAYYPTALYSLMQIHSTNESWNSVITMGTPLKKEKNKGKEYYSMMAKAYYELGDYQKAIKASEEASESEKIFPEFLKVWRDSLLSNDIRASLKTLNKYFQIAKKKNPSLKENEFFIVNTKEGKGTLSNLINGY